MAVRSRETNTLLYQLDYSLPIGRRDHVTPRSHPIGRDGVPIAPANIGCRVQKTNLIGLRVAVHGIALLLLLIML